MAADPAGKCAAGCGRPVADAFLCLRCTRFLGLDLLSVPWLCHELSVTLSRQDRVQPGAGAGAESETPMPVRLRAMQAADTLQWTLWPWARIVAESRGSELDCLHTTEGFARWLVLHLASVRASDFAAELMTEVTYAVEQARRAIDQPPSLCYRGPCDRCGTDLYCGADHRGRPVLAVISCRVCGEQYDAAAREAWLLDRAEHRLATATEIAQAVPALYGTEIKAGTIRQWIARGRLIPRGWLHQGRVYPQWQTAGDRPLCRIGDVIELARQQRAG